MSSLFFSLSNYFLPFMAHSILPTASTSYHLGQNNDLNTSNNRHRRNSSSLLHKLVRYPHMDFEFALWQMGYLLIAPRRVYRNIYYHKQTKNQWSRDDPAFIVLLVSLLIVSGLLWGITYHLGGAGVLKLMVRMIVIDFLLMGAMIATFTWYLSNKFLIQNTNAYTLSQSVEWAYAFDVHCNSFVPVYLILYLVQLFFLPLLVKFNWIAMFIGNLMYCTAFIWYMVSTFLGFNALPFLVHTELFLYPVALCIVLFVASLFGVNITHSVLHYYFP
ncbi:UNC-50 [Pilobolus umbonatus]|nr:UNC-50 [Pilobolus umbonatus]